MNDKSTEPQARLLSKVLRYIKNIEFKRTNVYFVFNVPRQHLLSKRIQNFTNGLEKYYFEGMPIIEKLEQVKVSIFAYPIDIGSALIASSITEELLILKTTEKHKQLLKLSHVTQNLIVEDNTDSEFSFYTTYTNHLFLETTVPIIFLPYGKIGNKQILNRLYQEYSERYDHIIVLVYENISCHFPEYNAYQNFFQFYYPNTKEEQP